MKNFHKTVLITGSTRGIGEKIGQKLTSQGHTVIISGKSVDDNSNNHHIKLDLRSDKDIIKCKDIVKEKYGSIDVLINNASAMWWQSIENTPYSKYNLLNEVNVRGTYLLSRELLPYINKGGSIITHSPPIDKESMELYINSGFKNKIAYMVSKLGMSIVASGLAQELKEKQISSNCIWPSTAIESAAMKNNSLIPPKFNNPKLWRKADIIADMVSELIKEDYEFTNNFLIDEIYLRSRGYLDFEKYQCVSGYEPPKLHHLFSKE